MVVCGAWAGAEVEGLSGEAAMLEAHHVRPARRPILHIAQVCLLIELHMAAAARQEEHPRDLCCYQTGLLEKLGSGLLAATFISVSFI